MESEHLQQLEKSKNAITIIDKILPDLPDYGVFHFAYYAKEVLNWPPKEIEEIVNSKYQIVHIALNHFQYINEKTKGYYYELNDKGRRAKSKGGHFKYLKYLRDQKKIEVERQERKDKFDKLDLVIKQWQVKTKYLPYAVSFIALIFSILSYFKLQKKQSDLQSLQQQIQELQMRVNRQDSLLRSDVIFKNEKAKYRITK